MKKILSLSLIFMFSQVATASQFYPYNELLLKDLEEMSRLVSSKIKEYEDAGASGASSGSDEIVLEDDTSSDGEAPSTEDLLPLRQALQAVYSRPNLDDMIQKVIGPLRSTLDGVDGWEKAISQLIDEGLVNLKNPKKVHPRVQATYSIMLDNLVSELKMYAKEQGFERQMLEKIKKANIKLTREAQSEIKLRVLKEPSSPSHLAEVSLEAVDAQIKKEKKERAKEK